MIEHSRHNAPIEDDHGPGIETDESITWADYNKPHTYLPMSAMLAVVAGVLVSDFLNWTNALLIACIGVLIVAPVLFRYRSLLLFFSWNASVGFYCLPGSLPLWIVIVAITLVILFFAPAVVKHKLFVNVSVMTWPIVAFILVVVATLLVRGGIGLNIMGGKSAGGTKYFWVLAALLGYFALSMMPVPKSEQARHVAVFFLGGITYFVGPVAAFLGGVFSWLVMFFPSYDGVQSTIAQETIRIKGFGYVGLAICSWLLAVYGLGGMFGSRRWMLKLSLFCIGVIFLIISGFRTYFVLVIGIMILLCLLERHHRRPTFIFWLAGCALAYFLLYLWIPDSPHFVQRTLSFIPGLPIGLNALADAQGTVEWRQGLWRELIADVPQYFWMGKGLAIPAGDMAWAETMVRFSPSPWYLSYITGEHHNGILSILVSFGIWGLLAFAWIACTGAWLLHSNMRYGEADRSNLNRFLFASFLVNLLLFCTYSGTLYWQLRDFTGILGISVALNHGVARKHGCH